MKSRIDNIKNINVKIEKDIDPKWISLAIIGNHNLTNNFGNCPS